MQSHFKLLFILTASVLLSYCAVILPVEQNQSTKSPVCKLLPEKITALHYDEENLAEGNRTIGNVVYKIIENPIKPLSMLMRSQYLDAYTRQLKNTVGSKSPDQILLANKIVSHYQKTCGSRIEISQHSADAPSADTPSAPVVTLKHKGCSNYLIKGLPDIREPYTIFQDGFLYDFRFKPIGMKIIGSFDQESISPLPADARQQLLRCAFHFQFQTKSKEICTPLIKHYLQECKTGVVILEKSMLEQVETAHPSD